MTMDRYISPCKTPEGFDRELLEKLGEEGAEVTHRVFKILAFGLEEIQHNQPWTNKERLFEEVGQLLYIIDLSIKYSLLDVKSLHRGRINKPAALAKYMQNQPPDGWKA